MIYTQLFDSFEYSCLLRLREMISELNVKDPYTGIDAEIAKYERKGTTAIDLTRPMKEIIREYNNSKVMI